MQGTPDESSFEIAGGEFHADLVVNNKALLGVVNARKPHFEAAAEWLGETSTEILDELVTGVYGIGEIDAAFADSTETIQSVVSFDG